MKLLQHGLIREAQALDDELGTKKKEKKPESDNLEDRMEEEGKALDIEDELIDGIGKVLKTYELAMEYWQLHFTTLENYVNKCLNDKEARRFASENYKVTVVNDARKRIMQEFMRTCLQARRCGNCQGISPPLRRDGAAKLFQLRLSKKDRNAMEARRNKKESEGDYADEGDFMSQTAEQRFLNPLEVRKHIQNLFREEAEITTLLFGARNPNVPSQVRPASYHMFFIEVLAVAPTRFRPPSVMGDKVFESPQNALLSGILRACHRVRELSTELQEAKEKAEHDKTAVARTQTMFVDNIIQLQHAVNSFIDSTKNPGNFGKNNQPPPGIRQALEKKEGLFRKHMMGKRVNYAARSVISPDPNIETSEIGVPPVFAKKLTYPEPVTAHNVKELRQAVINGPFKWPGATHVQHEDQSVDVLALLSLESRIALANSLLAPRATQSAQPSTNPYPTRTQTLNKKVFRHLRNGDMLLLNRQPTLHKPSIMAHKARVLPGEKTIRMHYANCNTYNADFDGDEMNMHFPQNEIARAEAALIANTDNQYLVPTSGNPLRGLIQDHVVSGVWMTSRGTFFNKEEYQQLLYGSLRPEEDGTGNGRILTLPPAIWKPKPLWTGKQVISTILLNLTVGKSQLNLTSKAKVPARFWGPNGKEEETVLVMDGQLLTGVLDKSQFGASAYGLVHSVYELYGPESAGKILSIFGRLFTKFVQTHGFTCRMDDLRLTEEGDKWRRQLLDEGQNLGREAHLEYLGLAETAKTASPETLARGKWKRRDPLLVDILKKFTHHIVCSCLEFKLRMEEVARDDDKLAGLDNAMKAKVNKLTSSITEKCLPNGLVCIQKRMKSYWQIVYIHTVILIGS